MFYIWMFFTNVFISTFTFGGGYVVIPMIQKYFVDQKHCFSQKELLEMAAVAQTSPGAIAVNLAVLAGYRCKGMKGAAICCLGAVLPPLILISLLSLCYDSIISNASIRSVMKGMEAGAAALIADLIISMLQTLHKEQSCELFLLIPITFIFCFFFHFPILPVILAGTAYCFFWISWRTKK